MTAKLIIKNDWESLSFFAGKKEIKDLFVVEIDGVQYEVLHKFVNVEYSDHGHLSCARSRHYFVEVPIFGTMVLIDLADHYDTVPMTAITYTLKD